MWNINTLNWGVFVSLVIMLVWLMKINYDIDVRNRELLLARPCHRDGGAAALTTADRLTIEAVIDEYLQKKSMNKSNCNTILRGISAGALQGFIIGALLDRGIHGALVGAMVSGAVGGAVRAYSITGEKILGKYVLSGRGAAAADESAEIP